MGRRLGPFDIGFMECGQYNEHWRQIHMFPEDSVRAALDSGVQRAIPVHWGGFSLAQHTWTAPAERFIQEAQKSEMTFGTPRIGQQFTTHNIERSSWWEDFK